MKKILSLLLCFSLVFVLTACQGNKPDMDFRDTEGYDSEAGFAASLTLGYNELRKKYPEASNDVCFYILAQDGIPENREVKFCYTDVLAEGWREAQAMELTSSGVAISDERRVFTFGKYLSIDVVTKMTGYASIDDLFNAVGQVQTYDELDDFCAFTVRQNTAQEYTETLYYGSPNDVKTVELKYGELRQPPSQSLQITKDNIFYFAYIYEDRENSFITITQVPRNGDDVRTYQISYSEMGLPPIFNNCYFGNIFIDGDFLFFIGEYTLSVDPSVETEVDVVVYDLKSNRFDLVCIQDADGAGKIFRYGDELGVVTASFDEQGYLSNTKVHFFELSTSNCTLSEKSTLSLPLSADWEYSFEKGADFYCINDTLCGMVTENKNGSSYAYIEIDLKNGAVTTFIPFAKNDKKANKGLFYGGILIRENGKAVSPFNCY